MSPLALVILAGAGFVGTHFLLSHPLRAPLVARIGEGPFLGLYSLVAAVTLGLLVWAAMAMPSEPFLWVAPDWLWAVASGAMLLGSILFVGSLVKNPAVPNPGKSPTIPDRPAGVYAITRHPMMWGFALWGFVHLAVWPQPSTIVVAVTIIVLALVGAVLQDAKKRQLYPEIWPRWAAMTSYVPFGRGAAWSGWGVVAGGVALWLLAAWLHPTFGAPLVGPFRWLR